MPEAQARLTYRKGILLLKDLTESLKIMVDPRRRGRLTEADLPALVAATGASGLTLTHGPTATLGLLRLVRRDHIDLVAPFNMARDPFALRDPTKGSGAGGRSHGGAGRLG